MTNIDVIRAWKDANYRNSLSDEELAALPENPIGGIELSDADLDEVQGGGNTFWYTYCSTCPTWFTVDCCPYGPRI